MAKNKFYAVKKGHKTGIFKTWATCEKHISGYSGSMYKAFKTLEDAEAYMEEGKPAENPGYTTEDEVIGNLGRGEVIAYVDGSNLGDGSKFSWGAVVFTEEGRVDISGHSDDKELAKHRNVSGELFASVKAVKYAVDNGANKITIYHDYSGIRHWALGEWKAKNKLSKDYKAFFEKARGVIDVEFVKVAGHTGDIFNEEADQLAKRELGIK